MRKGRIFLVIFLIIILLFLNLSNLKGEDEKDYLFHVNIILPTSNSVRMGYSSLLVDQFAKIGIEAELDMLSMTAFIPRVLEQVVGPYMNGGYDIALFGVTDYNPCCLTYRNTPYYEISGIEPNYGSTALPPNGFNIMYWSEV